MKAIVWTQYGPPDVLELREVEKPTPKDEEVLIRIFAASATSGDCEQRSLSLPFWYALPMRAVVGFKKPARITILGMELAGEIKAVGNDVKRFEEGDQVFAATSFMGMGGYAEYICVPEEPEEGSLAIKPANMTYEEAAAVPIGGHEALCFLRQGYVQSGQKILINGAGGTIGPFAVQIAKHFGADVTAVDSTEKLDMLRSIGADQVIDFTQEDFTKSGETYDLILDVIGKSSFSRSIGSLGENGCYLIADPGPYQMVRGRWTSIISSLPGRQAGKKMIFGAAHPNSEDLVFLKELIEAGKIRSVIDRHFPLEKTVEAHRYIETGRKIGNVIITLEHGNMT